MMRAPRLLALLLLLAPTTLRAQAPASVAAARDSAPLRPGDMVRLVIWRENDLSGDFLVDENGMVVLPKLGPMNVTALPPAALKAQLVESYQRYLKNPSIEVLPLRRVTILGAVKQAGTYRVDPTMTVADALSLAGGVMPEGSPDRVELRRDGTRVLANLRVKTLFADSPVQSGDQLYVPSRSWAARNSGLVATLVSASTSLFVAFLLR